MAANAVNIQANMVLNTQSLNASTREIKQALGRITGNASEFQKSLDASTARVFAFGATTTVINGVTQSFKALVSTTIDVEKRLIEINSIFGGTAREFNAFRDSIFQVAKDTGQSFSTVADAAAEFARQGLSAEETAKRLEAALILTRVSGLDSVKSVSALTAAINGFASAGLTASQITNKLIAVDTAFAVSAKDLADGFSRAGSTAEDAGVSFDELLGIITAVQQKTSRGGAVIGNALKTIFTRIGRQGVIEDLQALGVAIDASQSGVQKLQAIGTAFEAATGDPTRQNAIKELAAGGFQINIISAALKDLNSQYSIYSQATETAAGATDEAFRKNQELNKSLAAQLNSLVVGFTNLAEKVGQLTFAPLLSTLTSLATKVTDFFNEALDPEKGNAFIKGLFKSIGSFLSGPGLLLITTAFFKIITLVAKYAKEGFKSVLSIGAETEKLKNIQVGIVNSLINDQKFRQDILNTTLTQAQKQQAVADAIERENRLLREQQQLLTLLSKQAAVKGVASFNKEKGFVDKSGKPIAASGFVPSFKASAQEAMMESSAAREHGYKAGKVFNTRLYDGSGRSFKATVNSAETIKTVRGPNGKLGTYVIPPNGMAANGFVPNFALNPAARIKAKKINSAGGYIPNFVRDGFEEKFGLKKSTVKREWNAFSKTYPQAPNLRNAFRSDTNTVQAYLQWRKSGEVSIQKTRAKEQSLLETLPQSKRQAKFGFIYPSNQPVVQTKSLKILGEDTAVKFLGVAAEPSDFLYKEVRSSAIKIAKEYAKNIGIRPDVVDENKFESILNQTFNEGSLQSFAGTIFESALQGSIGLAPSSATQGFDIPNKGIMSGLASAFSKISSKNKNQQLSAELSTLDKGDFKNALNDSNINSLINKIINDRAQVSSLNKAPVKKTANAARGYVPNFASPNAIAAMQRLLSDPAATQGEKANARKFLSKFRAGYSFGSTALKGRPISLRQVFDQLDGEVGISQLIDAAYASAGPTASIENVFSKFQQQTLLNPKKLRDLVSKKGYIPNFADPLKEAIGREILAGVPTSQIYIDKSASLKNAMNPMGLMVANRRDEPAGGFQGINRAKKEGLNPKKYGAGKGFIPNYAKKLPPIKIPEAKKPFAEVTQEAENVVGKFEKFSSGLDKAQTSLFTLSVASNTLFGNNEKLNNSINALITTLSIASLLSGPLKSLIGGFQKLRGGKLPELLTKAFGGKKLGVPTTGMPKGLMLPKQFAGRLVSGLGTSALGIGGSVLGAAGLGYGIGALARKPLNIKSDLELQQETANTDYSIAVRKLQSRSRKNILSSATRGFAKIGDQKSQEAELSGFLSRLQSEGRGESAKRIQDLIKKAETKYTKNKDGTLNTVEIQAALDELSIAATEARESIGESTVEEKVAKELRLEAERIAKEGVRKFNDASAQYAVALERATAKISVLSNNIDIASNVGLGPKDPFTSLVKASAEFAKGQAATKESSLQLRSLFVGGGFNEFLQQQQSSLKFGTLDFETISKKILDPSLSNKLLESYATGGASGLRKQFSDITGFGIEGKEGEKFFESVVSATEDFRKNITSTYQGQKEAIKGIEAEKIKTAEYLNELEEKRANIAKKAFDELPARLNELLNIGKVDTFSLAKGYREIALEKDPSKASQKFASLQAQEQKLTQLQGIEATRALRESQGLTAKKAQGLENVVAQQALNPQRLKEIFKGQFLPTEMRKFVDTGVGSKETITKIVQKLEEISKGAGRSQESRRDAAILAETLKIQRDKATTDKDKAAKDELDEEIKKGKERQSELNITISLLNTSMIDFKNKFSETGIIDTVDKLNASMEAASKDISSFGSVANNLGIISDNLDIELSKIKDKIRALQSK